MGRFFKWLGILAFILLSLPVLLVVFIIVIMGVAAMHEEFIEKNKTNYNITQKVYSDGRKTVESFGIRKQFAILIFASGKEKTLKKRLSLYNRDKDESIEMNVKCYKKISDFVYALGEKGYTKLNYETAEIIQSKNINLFSEEDIKIFKELESGKDGIKHQK